MIHDRNSNALGVPVNNQFESGFFYGVVIALVSVFADFPEANLSGRFRQSLIWHFVRDLAVSLFVAIALALLAVSFLAIVALMSDVQPFGLTLRTLVHELQPSLVVSFVLWLCAMTRILRTMRQNSAITPSCMSNR